MRDKSDAFEVLVRKPDGKTHLESPGVDGKTHLESPGVNGKIILIWIFRMWDGGTKTGLNWLRIGTGGGHL